jgi:hypothetical protein
MRTYSSRTLMNPSAFSLLRAPGSVLPRHLVLLKSARSQWCRDLVAYACPCIRNGVDECWPSKILVAQCVPPLPESVEYVENVCEEVVEYVGDCGSSGTGGGMNGILSLKLGEWGCGGGRGGSNAGYVWNLPPNAGREVDGVRDLWTRGSVHISLRVFEILQAGQVPRELGP